MTEEIPGWAVNVPPSDGVHFDPSTPGQWDAIPEDQSKQLSGQLLESILSAVVQASTGLYVPGPFGSAADQLHEWSAGLVDDVTGLGTGLDQMLPRIVFDAIQPGGGWNAASDPTMSTASLWQSDVSSCTYAISNSVGYWGLKSLEVTVTATSPSPSVYFVRNSSGYRAALLVTPGDKFDFSCYVRAHSDNPGAAANVVVYVIDSTGVNSPIYINYGAGVTTTTSWQKVSTDVVIPAGYDTAEFRCFFSDSSVGDIFYVDSPTIKETTAPTDIAEALFGQKQLATSILPGMVPDLPQDRIVDLPEDLGEKLPRETFDAITPGGRFNIATDPTMSTASLWNDDSEAGYAIANIGYWGIKSLEVTCLTGDGATTELIRDSHGDPAALLVTPADQFDFSCHVRAKSGNSSSARLKLQVQFTDSKDVLSPVAATPGFVSVSTSSWTGLDMDVVVPVGYDTASFTVVVEDVAAVGDVFYLDNPKIRETTAPSNIAEALFGQKQIATTIVEGVVPELPQDRVTDLPTDMAAKLPRETFDAIGPGGGWNAASDPTMSTASLWNDTANESYAIANIGFWGIKSLEMTCLNPASYCRAQFIRNSAGDPAALLVTPGDKFDLSVYVRKHAGNTGTASAFIQAHYSDSKGVTEPAYGYTNSAAASPSSVGWTKISLDIEVPAGYDTMAVFGFVNTDADVGDIFYWDNPVVKETTAPTNIAEAIFGQKQVATTIIQDAVPELPQSKVTDLEDDLAGAYGAAEDINIALFAQPTPGTTIGIDKVSELGTNLDRLGAMGLSGSNLVPDPSVEDTSLDGIRASHALTGSGSTWTHDDAHYVTGTRSLKCVYSGSSTPGFQVTPTLVDSSFPVQPGQVFYLSQSVYADEANTGDNHIRLYLTCFEDDGTPWYPGYEVGGINPTGGSWESHEVYAEVPAGCYTARARFGSVRPECDAGDTFWFDAFRLYEVTDASKINQALFGTAGPGAELDGDAIPVLPQSKVTDLESDLGTAQSTADTAVANASSAQAAADAAQAAADALQILADNTVDDLSTVQDEAALAQAAADAAQAAADAAQADADAAQDDLRSTLTAGNNWVLDPSFSRSAVWNAYSDGVQDSSIYRSAPHSRKLTMPGGTPQTIYATDDGTSRPYTNVDKLWRVRPGDVFYIEVWYFAPLTNSHSASSIFVNSYTRSSTDAASPNYIGVATNSLTSVTKGQWNKLSGYHVIPDDMDRFCPYLQVGATAPVGDVFYVDDFLVREVTDAHAADGKAVTVAGRFDAYTSGGANLSTNPGFEDTSQHLSAHAGVTYSTTRKLAGSRSAKIVTDGSTNQTLTFAANETDGIYISAQEGQIVYCEMWVRAEESNSSTGGGIQFGLWAYDGNKSFSTALSTTHSWASIGTGSWVKLVKIATVPSGIYFLRPLARFIDGTSGNTFYVDSVVIRDITEAYNAQGTADAAQGTANTAVSNAATADAKAVIAQAVTDAIAHGGVNLVPDPGFESSAVDAKRVFVNSGVYSYDTGQKHSGTRSIKYTMGTINGYYKAQPNFVDRMPVKPGQVFYLSHWVRANPANTGNNAVAIYLGSWNGSSTVWTLVASLAVPDDGGWHQVGGYVTVPANCYSTFGHFCSARDGCLAGDEFWFDDLEWYEVTEAYNAAVDAATAQGTANTAVTNAATADAKAVAADDKAVLAAIKGDAFFRSSGNLIPDPGFEETQLDSSRNGAAGVYSYDTSVRHTGLRSVKAVYAGGYPSLVVTPSLGAGVDHYMNVRGGQVFYMSSWMKADPANTGASSVNTYMTCYLDGDVLYPGLSHTITTSWAKYEGYVVIPEGTLSAKPLWCSIRTSCDSGDIFWIDDVELYEVTDAYNAALDAATADGKAVAAQGTANTAVTNAATAQTAANAADANADTRLPHTSFDAYLVGANNIVVNPTFEDTSYYLGGGGTYSTTHKHWGTRSLKITASGSEHYVRLVSNATSPLRIQAQVGQYFYVEYWVYAPTSNVGSGYGRACAVGAWVYDSTTSPPTYLEARFLNADVSEIGEGSWVKKSGVVGPIANSDATDAFLYLYLDPDVPANDVFYFDDVVVKDVTEAEGARLLADAADGKAEDAQDAADIADGKADTAQSTADTAEGKADDAQSDVDSVIDNVANSFLGGDDIDGASVSDARDAMDKIYSDLTKNTRSIQDLQAKQAGVQAKGTVVNIDFSDYPDGNLPAIFDVSYTGPGTSTLGVVNGVAQWRNTNNADRRGKVVYNGEGTATDFQIIRGTMAMAPQEAYGGGKPYFYAIGRVSNDGDDYVWARAYCNGWFIYKCDIGYAINNVETVWSSNNNLTWSLDMSFVLGVGSDPRTYQVWSGNTMVKEHIEVGTASMLGAGYRQWGSIAEIKSGSGNPRISGKISGSSVADNAPPAVNGSTARMYRTTTGTVSFPSGGPNAIPNSFFSHIGHESPDVDANTTYGTFTVSESKPYIINARIRRTATMYSFGALVLQVKPSGGSWGNSQYGPDHYMGHGSSAISGSWIQYLNEGDQVRLATYNTGGSLTCLSGESDGEETYFAIAGAG